MSGVTVDQYVVRFDVPVHQALAVRGVKGGGDLADDPRGPGQAEGALGTQEPGQVGALDVRHDQVEQWARLTRLMDRDDVGVAEPRRTLHLTVETLPEARLIAHARVEDFQGDPAVGEAHLLRQVHLAHGRLGEPADQSIPGQ